MQSIPFFLFFGLLAMLSTALKAQVQEGTASYYADKFEGKPTASGEKYKHAKLTAAHRTLPFGTVLRVTNTQTGQSAEVRVNDRGPFVKNRVLDVSKSAAEALGFLNKGLAVVKIEVIDAGDGKGSGPIRPIGQVTIEEKEFYDFEVNRSKPKGFGVQIGTYQELVNLVRLSQNLRTSYRKEVTVQVKAINGIKVYTIILGKFSSRAKAGDFLMKLQKKYPDAFIVDFQRL